MKNFRRCQLIGGCLALSASIFLISGQGFANAADYGSEYNSEESEASEVAGSLADAVKSGKIIADLRLRYEFVDQDGFSADAKSATLRSRLGFVTGSFEGFKALVEMEDIRPISSERYNDTLNGKVQFPVVADPEVTELNRAILIYDGIVPDTKFWLGRQRIKLDNDRFVGNVGFRQNEQTFDGLRFTNQSIEDVTLDYTYLVNVNRIFGEDSPNGDHRMNSHLANLSYTGVDRLKVTTYAYLLDYDRVKALSSDSYGVRLKGWYPINDDTRFLYTGEYAHQNEGNGNPTNYSDSYYLFEAGAKYKKFSAVIGYETLEGDGTVGFATPLATGHIHNGWADQFVNTPPDGLEDLYLKMIGWVQGVKLMAVLHNFESENTSVDLGQEYDFLVSKKFADHYTVSGKAAFYEAGDAASGIVDITKIWVTVAAEF